MTSPIQNSKLRHWTPILWTLLLALVALLDAGSCIPQWMEGWARKDGRRNKQVQQDRQLFFLKGNSKAPYEEINGTEFCPASAVEDDDDCENSTLLQRVFQQHHRFRHFHAFISVFFCLLCMIEAIRRALQARQTALDMEALDEFEKSLAKAYSASRFRKWFPKTVGRQRQNKYGSERGSRHEDEDSNQDCDESYTEHSNDGDESMFDEDIEDHTMVRQVIRVWTPVLSTLFGWCILLPWPLLFATVLHQYQSIKHPSLISSVRPFDVCGHDPSFATRWLTQVSQTIQVNLQFWHEEFETWIWKVALPVRLWMKPLKLIHRLRLLSRWIRHFRYAGPLLRLVLKLQDQAWVFGKTWNRTWNAQTEKAKRLASRSMLFQDIQRLESLTKFQARLAALPSQIQLQFRTEPKQQDSEITDGIALDDDIGLAQVPSPLVIPTSSNVSSISGATAETDITQDMKHSSLQEKDERNFFSSLPSTPQHSNGISAVTTTASTSTATTITPSPSRPGVAAIIAKKQQESRRLQWRLNSLKRNVAKGSRHTSELYDRMVELTQEVTRQVHSAFWNKNLISPHTRFSVGWRLIVTLCLLSELGRLLLSWQVSGTFVLRYHDLTKRLLGLCRSKSRPVRTFIGKIVRLPPNHPWLDTCRQSSPSSQFSLTVARFSEVFIDTIGFLDILVWFYTGELDKTGVVVLPKPFFSRCILPGTLTQILDHPTLPHTIPHYILYFCEASYNVGYSRVVRWILALYPAVDMLVVKPIRCYLFAPMQEAEYLNYTESLVHFTSNSSLLRLKASTTSNEMLRSTNGTIDDMGHNLEDLIEGAAQDDEHVDDEDTGSIGTFFLPRVVSKRRRPSNASYSNALHASISENDEYGLYY